MGINSIFLFEPHRENLSSPLLFAYGLNRFSHDVSFHSIATVQLSNNVLNNDSDYGIRNLNTFLSLSPSFMTGNRSEGV